MSSSYLNYHILNRLRAIYNLSPLDISQGFKTTFYKVYSFKNIFIFIELFYYLNSKKDRNKLFCRDHFYFYQTNRSVLHFDPMVLEDRDSFFIYFDLLIHNSCPQSTYGLKKGKGEWKRWKKERKI